MRWGEKDTCHFVKLYLSHRILWDHKLPEYKCKPSRHKAYSQLIADFKNATGISIAETECKCKIKNLRSTYLQEVAKIRNRSGPDFVFRPSIRWFSAWHKCFGKRNRNNSEEDTAYDDNEETAEDPHQKVWTDVINDNENENSNSDPFASEDLLLVLKPEPDESPVKPDTQNSYKIKRKKMKRSTSTDNSDRSYRGSIDSESKYKEDEFDIYGKYIATQLRKMDVQKALRLQLEIQSLVSEARISDLTG